MDIASATALFLDYVAGFQPPAAEQALQQRTPIDVKREHSLHVLENARLVLAHLDAGPWLENLGLLAALFHDVGRFPQFQRFGTFHDPSSLNHGLLGARTLAPAPRGSGLLDGLSQRERSLVRAVVAMHNRREVPRGIAPELRFITELVRDADKLDIMRVMLSHFTSETHSPVLTLNVEPHAERYTEKMYEQVMRGEQGDYRAMRWTNDFKLMLLGWPKHLNFNASRRLVLERGLVSALFDTMPDTAEMQTLQARIEEYIEEDLAKPEQAPPMLAQAAERPAS